MVYPKQSEMKRQSQMRIYEFLFQKKERWASWTELLNAKEIALSKRALSRNLKEMLKPDAEFPLIKAKRPFNPSRFLLQDLYANQGIFKGILKKGVDVDKNIDLLKRRVTEYLRFHSRRELLQNIEKVFGKRFYRRKEYLKRLNKHLKQFERIGYSLKPLEITHGNEPKHGQKVITRSGPKEWRRDADGIIRLYNDEECNSITKIIIDAMLKHLNTRTSCAFTDVVKDWGYNSLADTIYQVKAEFLGCGFVDFLL